MSVLKLNPADDPFYVATRPVPGLTDVCVKVCGPGFAHVWNVPRPHEAPIEFVTLEEFSEIRERGGAYATDLIVNGKGEDYCNLWDGARRRWVILSK